MMRLATEWVGSTLFIDPGKAATIASVFGPRLSGAEVTVVGATPVDHDVRRTKAGVVGDLLTRAVVNDQVPSRMPVIDNVAVIAVEGTLVRKGAFLGQSSGETSYQGLRAQVMRARADRSIKGVVLEVDSFGGHVTGLFELGEQIAALSAEKPTIAILTDFGLSAGYFIASQARQVVMPPRGAAGSIGAVRLYVDESGALEKAGRVVTVIRSGSQKFMSAGLNPLPEDILRQMQASVDQARDDFAAWVGKARGSRLTKEAALATEAAILEGEDAYNAGLVDAIDDPFRTFEAFTAAVNRRR
jgi:ClpP class serine protease